MNLAEITHRAYFLDCYPLDERHLKISIQAGKDAGVPLPEKEKRVSTNYIR